MLKMTRLIVKRFWGLIAFLVIVLAILVVIGRELAPQIKHYKPDIVAALSESLGVDVAIEDMSATWQGLSPELRLSNVVFTNQNEETILSVGSATAKLSLLRSLVNWQLAWGNIELVQVDMGFTQHQNHQWSLIGLPETTTSQENINIDDPIDIFLLGRHIELRQANLSFHFRTGHISTVKLPYALMENSGDFHRFSSEMSVDGNTDVMKMVLEGEGDPRDLDNFSAVGYVRLQQFELERAVAALPGELWEGLPEKEWREGHQLNLEVWVDILPGMKVVSNGRFDVGELPVALEEDFPFPKKTGGNFSSLWDETGEWNMSIRNLIFDWDDIQAEPVDLMLSSDGLGEPVHVQMHSIDIAAWMTTLNQAGFMRGKLKRAFDQLNPAGVMQNVLLSIEGAKLEDVRLKANLIEVSVGAWNGAPELKQVNGYIEATPLSGFVDLNSQHGFSMFYPKIYNNPMYFDQANGRVHWSIDLEKRAANVHSGLLEVRGEEGLGRGYFSLFAPFDLDSQQEELILQVGLRDSVVDYHKKFVPFVAPKSLLDWMDQSIQSGRVEKGGFIYRGGFTEGSIDTTALQLYVDVKNAELNYHADWPAITEANGEVWLNDTNVNANITEAKFFDASAKDTFISVGPAKTSSQTEEDNLLIEIAGKLSGKAKTGLRIINETPIRTLVGDKFQQWQLTGDMDANVELEIPLQISRSEQVAPSDNQQAEVMNTTSTSNTTTETPSLENNLGRQHVEVDLSKASLTIPDVNLTFDRLKGKFIYDDQLGLTSEKITGRLWNKKVNAAITKTTNDKTQTDFLLVNASGKADVDDVQSWIDLPLLDFMSGDSDFDVQVSVPYSKNAMDQADVVVTSSLQGIAMDAPSPLGKDVDTKRNLKITVPLQTFSENTSSRKSQVYQVEYQHLLNGEFWVEGNRVTSAAINLSESVDNPPTKPRVSENKFIVKGNVNVFEYESWFEFYQRYSSIESQSDNQALNTNAQINGSFEQIQESNFEKKIETLYPNVNVEIGQFVMSGFEIDDMRLNAYWADQSWKLHVDSQIVSGDLVIADDPEKPFIANLTHLHILTDDYDPTPQNPFLPRPEKKEIADVLADWNPRELPAVEFSVSEFTLNKEDFGSWSFDVIPTDTGTLLQNITGEIRGGYVIGNENQTGATLHWDIDDQQNMQTHLSGRFVSDKFEDVLTQWGQPELLESEASKFDVELRWDGSPAAVSTVALQGAVHLLIEKGSFYQDEKNPNAGGAFLQLISFFNFDTWMRRLRLDFSDLTRKGMAFDQMEGTLHFDQGKVQMRSPLIVDMPSGKLQAVGDIDLLGENVDATLVATVPVGGNLTLFTALAAGLPAAVGVYIISKIFEKQVDKVASVRYRVTGKLSEPEFEFDKLFGNEIENEAETVTETEGKKENLTEAASY